MFDHTQARIGADIGGTFTDIVLESGERRHSIKVLTTHGAPERALLDGIHSLLAEAGLTPGHVKLIVHGTTLATNALIERRGAQTALLTTQGVRDVLELGSESRFDQYDLAIEKPTPLVPRQWRCGVPERMAADGSILLPLDDDSVKRIALDWRDNGVESIAIAFLHSYANGVHERRAANIIRSILPNATVSLSCEVSPEMREYERFSTTVANAYVQPLVTHYLRRLDSELKTLGFSCPLFLMLSSGGLTGVETAARFPVRLVESGPAGGAIFAANIAKSLGLERVLALDVGGTTAKFCLVDHFIPRTVPSFEVARIHRFRKGSGLPLRIPVVEMVEIGAGGGSIATIDTAGRLQVGPQSAGSEPGPAAYGRGGTKPTVTDADLVLGRIDPIGFAGGRLPLDKLASAAALLGLGCWGGDAESAALGVSEIVDETMAGAARVHINEQGAALDGRSIIAFGGAAPLHAARIAEKLGIDQVIIPPSAGVGSAVGFLRAPISYEIARSKLQRLNALEPNAINDLLTEMANEAHAIVGMGAPEAGRIEERLCFARYVGQGYEIPVPLPSRPIMAEDQFTLQQAFEAAYRDLYGGVTINLPIEILTWRVTVRTETKTIFQPRVVMNRQRVQPTNTRTVIDSATGKELKFSIYAREHLKPGDCFDGPALVTEMETTSVIGPSFAAHIDAFCNIVMDYHREAGRQ